MRNLLYVLTFPLLLYGCSDGQSGDAVAAGEGLTGGAMMAASSIDDRLEKYTTVRLTADLSDLTPTQRQLIDTLIQAARIMDELFWIEAYGEDWRSFLDKLPNEQYRRFARINYGPWDRLAANEPFLEEAGAKPAGANFYPADITKEEFESARLPDKASLYTFVRRDADGVLYTVPYHEKLTDQVGRAAELLKAAADLAEDPGLKKYLTLRAQALLDDNYQPSDLAWMDMKDNPIDVVIGPIETYEDQLYGFKAAHEAYVLIKDMEWSERLAKYAQFLPELQRGLPVPDAYKAETPGSDADLNAYDVVYYAGDCNAGSKTIAINLPNDEEVQLQKGTRRLQLKNAMRAKFDKIMLPIAGMLIAEEQRSHITFDAFFANTMFHEVAHGLGIKNVVDGNSTVREALQEHASALEEGKADVLGLYMIKQLYDKGELQGDLHDYYVTFMAGIFRSVRFGATSAHGRANMIRFNYFQEKGAFTRDQATGVYRVNFEAFEEAVMALSREILTLQGDGNYKGVAALVDAKARIGDQLQTDLDRLSEAEIPVDIVFEQGVEVLGM